MPSETIYFTAEQREFIQSLTERDGINNVSQAVQYCVNQAEQREEL